VSTPKNKGFSEKRMSEEKTITMKISRSKVFVSENGLATITCPYCNITRQTPVGHYCGKKHQIKAQCTCGESFLLQLEFRKNYRKPTKLEGTYRIVSKGAGGGFATVHDISRNGIGFTVTNPHNIEVGQKVELSFSLDNRKATRLLKEVIIRSVKGDQIGCEFLGSQAFEKDLGFYLQAG